MFLSPLISNSNRNFCEWPERSFNKEDSGWYFHECRAQQGAASLASLLGREAVESTWVFKAEDRVLLFMVSVDKCLTGPPPSGSLQVWLVDLSLWTSSVGFFELYLGCGQRIWTCFDHCARIPSLWDDLCSSLELQTSWWGVIYFETQMEVISRLWILWQSISVWSLHLDQPPSVGYSRPVKVCVLHARICDFPKDYVGNLILSLLKGEWGTQ